MILGGFLAAGMLVAQAAAPSTAPAELDGVRQLYATASYEEALTRLSTLEGRVDPNQLDRYRALSLLGLGRTADAEQALERIVLRAPDFRLDPADTSPAFLSRFAAVRKRALPIAANRMYARARTSYDVKDFETAIAGLEELLILLRAERSSDATLAELQQTAEGFLRLTRAELAAASRRIYTSLDLDVTPPVEVERRMPPWNPPAHYGWRWFRGVVEVVVDERGQVETARLAQSIADFYDASLIEAARGWRFQPATRNGQAVKYRQRVEITMRSQ
jgi:TonB family protein